MCERQTIKLSTSAQVFSLFIVLFVDLSGATLFTDVWAVHVKGGSGVANEVARRHGFINRGQIMPDYYHFQHRKVAKRSAFSSTYYHRPLQEDDQVLWAEQQVAKKRRKRSIHFNDPKWPITWYLNHRGQGLGMNVRQAWDMGYTGKGVVVTILDDGIEKDHPDLIRNYDKKASYDVNDHDPDPQPRYEITNDNKHGTRCAGEVAAQADNHVCSVGVAFNARIGGVRMLDGDVTDAIEAQSLSHEPQYIHIYSASWGPDDDGRTVDGPATLTRKAFYDGISKGRGGLGSIFVWASGNGGRDKDDCNCDGYTSSIYTMSISGATEKGKSAWYSEACSSTLATTYSSGGEKQIVTTDLRKGCTEAHTGTSASAPLAAGIIALTLEANPNLTWRDMQHIVVETAKSHSLNSGDWVKNGVGKRVSHSFGFGLMDAGAMVKLARNWTTVPEQRICEIHFRDRFSTQIKMNKRIAVPLTTDACAGNDGYVRYLEHVQARITMTSSRRGELRIFLTSPSLTRSTLLNQRPHDVSEEGFNNWAFMTTHNWGEPAQGTWTLEIENGENTSELKKWTLVLMGTSAHQMRQNQSSRGSTSGHYPGNFSRMGVGKASSPGPTFTCAGVSNNGICIECKPGFFKMGDNCVAHCPQHFYGSVQTVQLASPIKPNSTKPLLNTQGVCKPCHESCLTCKGSVAQDCFQCASGFERKGDLCAKKMIWDMLDPDIMKHLAWAIIACIAAIVMISVIFGVLQARDKGRLCWRTKSNYKPDWTKGYYDGVAAPGWKANKFSALPAPPATSTGNVDTTSTWRMGSADGSISTSNSSSWKSGSLRTVHDSGVGSLRSGSGGSSSPLPSTGSSVGIGSQGSPEWHRKGGKSVPLPPLPLPPDMPLLSSPPSPSPLPPSDLFEWGGARLGGDDMILPPPKWRDQIDKRNPDQPPPLPPRPSRPVEAFWEAAGPGTGTHFLSAGGSTHARPDSGCSSIEDGHTSESCVLQEAGMVIDPTSNWLNDQPTFPAVKSGSSERKDEQKHHHRRRRHSGQHKGHHRHHRRHYSAGIMPAYSPTRVHHDGIVNDNDFEDAESHQHNQLYQQTSNETDMDLDSSIDNMDAEQMKVKFARHTPPPPTPPPAKMSEHYQHSQTMLPSYRHCVCHGGPLPTSSTSPSRSDAQNV